MIPRFFRFCLWLSRKIGYLLFGEELSKTLRSFRENIGSIIEIDDILPPFQKSSVTKHPKLWVETHWQMTRGYGGPGGNIFFFDAHYSFVLWAKQGQYDIPFACIAFDPFGYSGICVRQIQGRKGYELLSKSIKWERLLIAIVQKWAKKQNIRKI